MAKYRRFWMHFFKGLDAPDISGEVMVNSIFRHEDTPSMSINLNTGFWKDFGDSEIGARTREDGAMSDGGGDAIRFIETLYEVPYPVAKKVIEEMLEGAEPILPISNQMVQDLHEALLQNKDALQKYIVARNLTLETIQMYKIGWDAKMKRYTIPIMGAYGYWVNIRKYSLGSAKQKMINHSRKRGEGGYGHSRLFPIRQLYKSEQVVIFEGEHDALLAVQLGIRAVTSTGGAGVFPRGAEDYFYGKTVYLCYDNDEQGRTGMEKVAKRLDGIAKEIWMCPPLPIPTPDNADFTDFINQGHTREDFADMVLREAAQYVPTDDTITTGQTVEEGDYQGISLAQALDPGFQNKPVSVDALVVGKGKQPFTIEKELTFTCDKMNPDAQKCQSCGIFAANGRLPVNLTPTSSETLLFIKAHNTQKHAALKQLGKIPRNCDLYDVEVDDWQNVEELLISPQVQAAKQPGAVESDSHFHQAAFHIYPTNTTRIDANRTYEMKAVRTTDPWQQGATFLIQDADPMQSSIETFKLSDDLKEKLKVFQVKEGQTVKEKFDEIHEDIEYNVSRIFGRRDLMSAIDLAYHSSLRFVFQNKVEHKGWLEVLVLGDTRTGKSESAEWMGYHYQLGEFGTGESSSLAGLLGGLQQGAGGNNWMLTWGKIPLNDRGLFVIDEVSGLGTSHIGQLSGIRSMGVAELTKIRQERTNARTRLIWISNPRQGKFMDEFEYGVEAISPLIGANEDIARFDHAVTAASGEVSRDEINKNISDRDEVPHVYTTEVCNALILWGWSRNLGNIQKHNQIIFTEGTEELILKYASEFGEKYSSKIPLVEGANHRIKLAKMAVAAAIRVFSTDESFEKVLVKPEHVHFIAQLQHDAYSKPSMGYAQYSEKIKEEQYMSTDNLEKVRTYIESYPELLDGFRLMRVFSFTQLQQLTGYEPEILREHVHFLTKNNIMSVKSNGQWTLTMNGISLIRQMRDYETD